MQSGVPRRRPMAMRIVLSMRRPREVTGRVCNQESDSFLEADKSLALDKGSAKGSGQEFSCMQWKKLLVDPTISVDVT